MATVEQNRRLERARNQYDILLMHATDGFLDDLNAVKHNNITSQFLDTSNQHSSPEKLAHSNGPTFNQTGIVTSETAFLSDEDKDSMIISLQKEVERLRHKLNDVIENAQDVIKEAQDVQAEQTIVYERKLAEMENQNAILQADNCELRLILNKVQCELELEQENVLVAANIFDRNKRRNHRLQEKRWEIDKLITSTAALNMTHIVHHSPSPAHLQHQTRQND